MLALLTEEQEMLKQTASQLASSAGVHGPTDLSSVDRTKVWAALSDSGFLALRVRDEEGVPTASGVEVMLVCEAFGAALAPVPYLGGIVAAELMSRARVPQTWLDGLTSGETRYGLLLAPDLSRLARIEEAEGAIAFDVDEAGYALGLSGPVDAPVPVRVSLSQGFGSLDAADLTRRCLRLDDPSVVQADAAAPWEDRGGRHGWFALALVAASADVVGVMSSALQRAVDYAKERVQYGVKIGSFQAIQHMCADALVQIEASASATRFAAWAVDALDSDEALLAARVAKSYSSSVAREVTETVMQVFGGIGQTWEHVAHLHTRRALTDRAIFGDESNHLLRIADARLGS
jgi:alkylation response protein AidB-like acyl-CoA dehydrogenase